MPGPVKKGNSTYAGRARLNTYIEPEMAERFQAVAREQELTVSKLLGQVIAMYLESLEIEEALEEAVA